MSILRHNLQTKLVMKLNPSKIRKIGWICFSLMWIPFFAMFAGLWNMPSGSYDFDELSQRIASVQACCYQSTLATLNTAQQTRRT